MQFSTKIDGFQQKDSQGFENSYNSYEQYPLEKIFIFTIYQNYTLALIRISEKHKIFRVKKEKNTVKSWKVIFQKSQKLLTERAPRRRPIQNIQFQ